ncbi:hypothetical protein HTG_15195 [Natrinema mahii]|nr:hypothetical protein HTG_15195 [Natrinema mahii]
MPDRLPSVTAHTTLDYVEGKAVGETFEWESVAVVDATAEREDPESVRLRLERDNLSAEYVPKHMDALELAPAQARTLAADLEKHATPVEETTEPES